MKVNKKKRINNKWNKMEKNYSKNKMLKSNKKRINDKKWFTRLINLEI